MRQIAYSQIENLSNKKNFEEFKFVLCSTVPFVSIYLSLVKVKNVVASRNLKENFKFTIKVCFVNYVYLRSINVTP